MGGYNSLPLQSGRNPYLDEIDAAAQNAHAQLSPGAQMALRKAGAPVGMTGGAPAPPQQITNPRPAPPALAPMSENLPNGQPAIMAGTGITMPTPRPQPVPPTAAAGPAEAHLASITAPPPADPSLVHTKQNTGTAGVNQIHNPWARVPLQILAGIGETFAPRLAAALPGTESHHQLLVGEAENAVKQQQGIREAEEKARMAAATEGHLGAETANLESQVPLNQARTQTELGKPELNQQAADIRQQQADIAAKKQREDDERLLRTAGYRRDPISGELTPLPEEELSEPERAKIEQIHAITSLRASQQELAEANAALAQARAKNLPQQIAMAEARIATAQRNSEIAMQRLGLSQATYNMRALGQDAQGNPLPGAIITDSGQSVGSVNAANVRPTGTQRVRGDLATSAQHQLEDMRSIVKRHPEFFGPGAGRKTEFNVWLGSEDPDAARFRTARTILGDHEAGTFGGRSDQTVKNLEAAAGLFKTNPDAILGSLEQLEKANTVFKGAGTPRTVGSNRAGSEQVEEYVRDANGKLVKKGATQNQR